MLNPEHKKGAAGKKKPEPKKTRFTVRDLAPRKDSRGGAAGPPKSSPVSLPIPPQGFFASSDD
jgi:hypothetical protein